MKSNRKTIFKRITAIILLAVMFCTGAIQVFAATQVSVYCVNLPRGSETNKANWGHGQLTLMNGVTYASSSYFVSKAITSYTGKVAYCIEPGKSLDDGNALTLNANYWENLPNNATINASDIQKYVGRIMYYGYSGNVNVNWVSTNSTYADQDGISFYLIKL